MKISKFNEKWKFWNDKNAFALVWNIPNHAEDVTLPHDAMIAQNAHPDSLNQGNTGYRDGGVYVYVKNIHVPNEARDKTLILKFEGVYMNAFVYVNEQLAGKCPFGYTTFYVELNNFLKFGEENEIRVIVKNGAMDNSRWYTGSGIYRDVYLLESGSVHVAADGVQISTDSVEEDYSVQLISTELKNTSRNKTDLKLETRIVDDQGTTVASDEMPFSLFGNEARKVSQRIVINSPKCWSENTPNLYQCITRIHQDGKIIEETQSRFGIRKLQLDSVNGLRVNGERVKLRGACIHDDSGLIGTATYKDTKFRQVKRLKEAGFNAIRMSHHPMSQAMLRACDELGMYVMDESFDMWTRCKSDYDYGMTFSEWWEKDIEAMVRKDFNHPSVVMYSIGNEIPEIGTDYGMQLCHKISEKVKSLDSTRYTLASINGVFATGDQIDKIVSDVSSELRKDGLIEGNVNHFMALMEDHMDRIVVHPAITQRLEKACAGTDIAGYNYMTARYEKDHKDYPNRIIVGSETYPPDIARNWEIVKKYNYVIGDFTWTGWDYIGEAGVGVPAYQPGEGGFGAKYPCQLAYCGDIDITGYRRPASYYREIVFGLREQPYIAVQNPYRYGQKMKKTPWIISDAVSSWTWPECQGRPVVVEVYAPGDEVELLCNGQSLGRKSSGSSAGFRALFNTQYTPGCLEAVAYENNAEISRTTLQTADSERSIATAVEHGKNKELIYVEVAIRDQHGVLAADEKGQLNIAVEGDVQLIGLGTGNPKPERNYNELETALFQGRALAILKSGSGDKKGKVRFTYEMSLECEIEV